MNDNNIVRLTLRISKTLTDGITQIAKDENRSVNSQIAYILKQFLKEKATKY